MLRVLSSDETSVTTADHLAAGLANLRFRPLGCLPIELGNYQFRSFAGQPSGQRFADPVAGTGYDRYSS